MKKLAFCLALFLCIASFFTGCNRKKEATQSFFFMDTVITVTLYTNDQRLSREIFEECETLLADYEALWSRHREGSVVSRFLNSAECHSVELDDKTRALIECALDVSQKTDGAFDITLAPLSELWETAEERNALPTEAELSAALAVCGYEKLSLQKGILVKNDPAVQIDLGGIGKGAVIDELIAYLNTCSVAGGLVSFGSNVAVFGEKPDGEPFRIALRDPKDEADSVGTLLLPTGKILSVSGDYERFVTVEGENYHHILNSQTGYPTASGLSSVAVICEDGALADALSTALLCMGEEKALAFYESGIYDFEAVLISSDGKLMATRGLDGIFVEN